jgi:Gas vesicle protein K
LESVPNSSAEAGSDTGESANHFQAELSAVARVLPDRINADPERVEQGLARLVLTVIELLREVLEHQAVRRMDGGTLSDEQVEQLGLALLKLNHRMDELKDVGRRERTDWSTSSTACSTRGSSLPGTSRSIANVELLTIQVRLLVCSIDKAEQIGLNWWRSEPRLTMSPAASVAPENETRLARIEDQLTRLAHSPSAARVESKKRKSSEWLRQLGQACPLDSEDGHRGRRTHPKWQFGYRCSRSRTGQRHRH